ncbi:MAG: Mo-dependent nitrogenase C-terminal domain-containing protein [Candidatus Parcubacteria bacterium]|nr:Mo-dependent nitrogenase C-terminal domain-containing protein [Leptolyngbyaceae cyanobacterium LF-bin-113]
MKLQATQRRIALASWVKLSPEAHSTQAASTAQSPNRVQKFDLLRLLRAAVDRTQVRSPELAHRLCKLIPSQCPFERDVKVLGKTLFHIPPMCKLNPLYDEVVALRFRAMCYLADECGEDVSCYC